MVKYFLNLLFVLSIFACFFDEDKKEIDPAIVVNNWKHELGVLKASRERDPYFMPECYSKNIDSIICPNTASIVDLINGRIDNLGYDFWKMKFSDSVNFGHSTLVSNEGGIFLSISYPQDTNLDFAYVWDGSGWSLKDSLNLGIALNTVYKSPQTYYDGNAFYALYFSTCAVDIMEKDSLYYNNVYKSCFYADGHVQAVINDPSTLYADSIVGIGLEGEYSLNYPEGLTKLPYIFHENTSSASPYGSIVRVRHLINQGAYHKRQFMDRIWYNHTGGGQWPSWGDCDAQMAYDFKEYSFESTRHRDQIRLEIMHHPEGDTTTTFRADEAYLFSVKHTDSECPRPADFFIRPDGSIVFDDETGFYVSHPLGLPYVGW